jgi:hypothetical protein
VHSEFKIWEMSSSVGVPREGGNVEGVVMEVKGLGLE